MAKRTIGARSVAWGPDTRVKEEEEWMDAQSGAKKGCVVCAEKWGENEVGKETICRGCVASGVVKRRDARDVESGVDSEGESTMWVESGAPREGRRAVHSTQYSTIINSKQ